LKVGLLGAGYIVQAHAKALAAIDAVEMRAVCDVSQERAAQAAAEFGIPEVHTSLASLLASECDVVHVLVPPYLHESVTRQILDAGTSAFLEKPMGLDSKECDALVALAAEKGLRLGVNHNFLFLPSYEALRRDAADGTLGALDHVAVNWLYGLGLIQFGPYNNWIVGSEGNVLFELGTHLGAFRYRPARPPRRPGRDRLAADRAAGQPARLSPLERDRPPRAHVREPQPLDHSGAAGP
jgi:predicted dehydrogenase